MFGLCRRTPASTQVGNTSVSGLRVAVVGASLGGLSAANVLVRCGADVKVYECFAHSFHDRGGALGSVDVALMQAIVSTRESPRSVAGHAHFYGDLWRFLYEGLPENTVHFGVDVQDVLQADSKFPQIVIDGTPQEFDLIIAADGGKSTLRPYVTDEVPEYAGYTLWRGLVPCEAVPKWNKVGAFASQTHQGLYYETGGFPCAGPKGTGNLYNVGVYMPMPEQEVQPPTRNRQVTEKLTMPDWFNPFVHHMFGSEVGRFWDTVAREGKISPHPVWEFAADCVVRGRIVLLGDAAHMASPRTGAGAYTAMRDAEALGKVFQRGDALDTALAEYNTDGVRRAQQLLQASQRIARSFLPGGRAPVSPSSLVKTVDKYARDESKAHKSKAGQGAIPCLTFGHGPGGGDGVSNFLAEYIKTLPQLAGVLVIEAHAQADPVEVAGDAQLASRVSDLLGASGIPACVGPAGRRDMGHGSADVKRALGGLPMVTISLRTGQNAAEHLAMGVALAPLRFEGVLLLGSGEPSFHNFEYIFTKSDAKLAEGITQSLSFDKWLVKALGSESTDRSDMLHKWEAAPGARVCHPAGEAEHFMPTLVIAGAAQDSPGQPIGDPTHSDWEIVRHFDFRS